MTEVMNTLYQFIQEYRIGPLIQGSRDYREYCRCSRIQEDRLRAMLDEKGAETLESMLQELSNQHCEELIAMFRATMALCRELNGDFLL